MRDWAITWAVVVAMCAAMVVIALKPHLLPSWFGVATVPDATMEPTYQAGDVLVVVRQEAYEPGAVIAFELVGGEQQVARVVSGGPRGGYVVAGDAEPLPLTVSLAQESVHGRAWREVPAVIAPVARVVIGAPFLVLGAAIVIAALLWSPAHLRHRRSEIDRRQRLRARERQHAQSGASPPTSGRRARTAADPAGRRQAGPARGTGATVPAGAVWNGAAAARRDALASPDPGYEHELEHEEGDATATPAPGSTGRAPRGDGLADLDDLAPRGGPATTAGGLAGLDHLRPGRDADRPTPFVVVGRATDPDGRRAGATDEPAPDPDRPSDG